MSNGNMGAQNMGALNINICGRAELFELGLQQMIISIFE